MVWNPFTGDRLKVLHDHFRGVSDICLLNQNHFVSVGVDGLICLYNYENYKLVQAKMNSAGKIFSIEKLTDRSFIIGCLGNFLHYLVLILNPMGKQISI